MDLSSYLSPIGVRPQWWTLVEAATQIGSRIEGPNFPKTTTGLDEWAEDHFSASLGYLRELAVAVANGTLRASVKDSRTGERRLLCAEVMDLALRYQREQGLSNSDPDVDYSAVIPYALAAQQTLGVDQFDIQAALGLVQLNVEDLASQFLPSPMPPDQETLEWLFTQQGLEVLEALMARSYMTPKARSETELLIRLARQLEEQELREHDDDKYRHEIQARRRLRTTSMIDLVESRYEDIWAYRTQVKTDPGRQRASKRQVVCEFFDQQVANTLVDVGRYVTSGEGKARDLQTDRTSFYKRFCERAKNDPRKW